MARVKKIHPHVGKFFAISTQNVSEDEIKDFDEEALNSLVEAAIKDDWFEDGDAFYVMQIVGVKTVRREIKVADAEYAEKSE